QNAYHRRTRHAGRPYGKGINSAKTARSGGKRGGRPPRARGIFGAALVMYDNRSCSGARDASQSETEHGHPNHDVRANPSPSGPWAKPLGFGSLKPSGISRRHWTRRTELERRIRRTLRGGAGKL